ncbi:hypothetical protein BpHYR1_043932 [Brachionus plicatilis]|uniref:Uncharacterized protein n=1 Tax=Brachionus plicatilis TaxID=10195 RepID=A0A3M7RJM0_BRAPC|nr:hypothetical protein BpHYR1_043932 [Brachionus plicatilis]
MVWHILTVCFLFLSCIERKRLFKALKIIFSCVEEFFNLCLRVYVNKNKLNQSATKYDALCCTLFLTLV